MTSDEALISCVIMQTLSTLRFYRCN